VQKGLGAKQASSVLLQRLRPQSLGLINQLQVRLLSERPPSTSEQ
jgi:hypothetical protein